VGVVGGRRDGDGPRAADVGVAELKVSTQVANFWYNWKKSQVLTDDVKF
jgi:hypothetical protein